jgi:uncharacterized protein YbjT (DUF2867 family)
MILVTGATGTVGTEVVRQLVACGERPRILVRDADRARAKFGDAVDYLTADLDRPRDLSVDGISDVFLLSRQTSRQREQESAVIAAARRSGVRRLVKLSVFRADENSSLQVARQHRQAELVAQQSGLSCTIIRPTFFMQNLFVLLRAGVIRTAAEDGRVAVIDARDVASVAVAALTSRDYGNRTYTLTGPQPIAFDELADILTKATGRQVRHLRVPPDAVRTDSERHGAETWFAHDMATLHSMLAAGYEDVVTNDVTAATGTAPRTADEFARDFADRLGSAAA